MLYRWRFSTIWSYDDVGRGLRWGAPYGRNDTSPRCPEVKCGLLQGGEVEYRFPRLCTRGKGGGGGARNSQATDITNRNQAVEPFTPMLRRQKFEAIEGSVCVN